MRLRDQPLRTVLTRLGLHAVLLGSFALVGGALRGFNLLLVVAALLVAALLIQWRFNRRLLSGVAATRQLPVRLFAGQTDKIEIALYNRNRWLPAWMVRVTDFIEHPAAAVAAQGSCGVPLVAPRRTAITHYDCRFARRGHYRFGPLEMESIFPLALCRSRKTLEVGAELCVFPQLLELSQEWPQTLAGQPGSGEGRAARRGWSDGEFFGLRSWQPGDTLNVIHWRTTARLGEPAVRQFEQRQRRDLCLVVDGYAANHQEENAAETAISLAASLIVAVEQRSASRIVLGIAATEQRVLVTEITGGRHDQLLTALAEIKLSVQPPLLETVARTRQVSRGGAELIVLSPRRLEDVTGDPSTTLALSARRGFVRWVDVTGPGLQVWAKEASK